MGFLRNRQGQGTSANPPTVQPRAPYEGGYSPAPDSGWMSMIYRMAQAKAAQGLPTPFADRMRWDMGRDNSEDWVARALRMGEQAFGGNRNLNQFLGLNQ